MSCHDACDRGGYRTGKRPCMRRVIEYIASDFRKDKFWLRRVEPSKRQYQVMVAVDDSASMVFNHSKQVSSLCDAVFLEKLQTLPTMDRLCLLPIYGLYRLSLHFPDCFPAH